MSTDLAVLLVDVLDTRPDEFVAIGFEPRPATLPSFKTRVIKCTPEAVEATAAEAATGSQNTWVSVNPTRGPAREGAGRGTILDTTRLAAAWADLDVKPGGCQSVEVARAIIGELSSMLGTAPSAIVHSGHGLQPYWPIEDGHISDSDGPGRARAVALVRRWGRLVAHVAQGLNANVDSVYDIARVMRVPGSINYKDPMPPVWATLERGNGGPISLQRLAEVLDEYGIPELPDDVRIKTRPVDPDHADYLAPDQWPVARYDCGYIKTVIVGWASDVPNGKGRHPWHLAQATRISAAHRNGCLSPEGLAHAYRQLGARLTEVCVNGIGGTPRNVRPAELGEAIAFGNMRATTMSGADIASELGKHLHDGQLARTETNSVADDFVAARHDPLNLEGSIPPAVGQVPTDAYMEGQIRQRIETLRIDREARQRLDDETRPPLELPPVRGLAALLAEPDSATAYRIEGLAPVNGHTMLSAQFKAGKTTLLNNVVRSLVDDVPFLGRFPVNIPATGLVMIDNELSEPMLRQWLRAQDIRNVAAVADVVSLRGKVSTFNLLDDRCRAQWAGRLRDVGCDFLVFDCLRPALDALGLDESRDAGQFLVAFDALLDEAGVGDALLVQHMGHSGERARGDSRLQDWPDATWRLVRETEEPDSPRYFTAYGRDVDVPEGRLDFNPAARRLTYADGSRKNAQADASVAEALHCVVAVLVEHALGEGDGMGVNAIKTAVSTAHSIGNRRVTDALDKGAANGMLARRAGLRNAVLYTLANPCKSCRKPVSDPNRDVHHECEPK